MNLFNDADLMDEQGRDFRDLPAAKDEAIRSARELMAEHLMQGRPIDLDDRIEIADCDGKTLATIAFRELITIKDRRNTPR
ncbi:hypothetical protein LWE61_16370 [Sphingobium sufflavum]|nr:hypothetical protein [Sphingobium sufflavum]